MMEATNVSIEVDDLYEPLERLSTSCEPSLVLADLSVSTDVKEKRPSWKNVLDVKKWRHEGKGSTVPPSVSKDSVEALTSPVENLLLDDTRPPSPSHSRDSNDSLTHAALEEACSAALAVSSFLDDHGPPVKKRGRFQRRNSFVIHRDQAQSMDHSVPAEKADAPLGDRGVKFDMSGARSQSAGALGLTTRESNLVFQRMNLPWKRKNREAEP